VEIDSVRILKQAFFMDQQSRLNIIGRGSSLKIANRFERIELTEDWEQLDAEDQAEQVRSRVPTEYFLDQSESIVSQNNSPDIDFNFSVNPYRGCAHGCSYCYARPTHEYLGFNAGLDFESKIMVKREAAVLLRQWLSRPTWKNSVEPIMLSGVTDCYQGCEKVFKLTRQCLEVAREFRQPMRVITKNALISRDLDVLKELGDRQLVSVSISLASLDKTLIRKMEPRSSTPQARLDAIAALAEAGIPVLVLVAPIIPGINDDEIANILKAVTDVGARSASYTILRLPKTVEPVFLDWLQHNFPDRVTKVTDRIKSLRGGKLNDSKFGSRMKGTGIWSEQISQFFHLIRKKCGLERSSVELRTDLFQDPTTAPSTNNLRQLELF
jgi:DNA repair photolyase